VAIPQHYGINQQQEKKAYTGAILQH